MHSLFLPVVIHSTRVTDDKGGRLHMFLYTASAIRTRSRIDDMRKLHHSSDWTAVILCVARCTALHQDIHAPVFLQG